MDKREAVLSLLDEHEVQEYIPAGFFLHFHKAYHSGQSAVDKHLEYYRHTGMDFVKIQYENVFPRITEIKKPEDWVKMPLYKRDFYEGQLSVVKGLVKAAKKEALVIMTLYSAFMCAVHTVSDQVITRHIKENPEEVEEGYDFKDNLYQNSLEILTSCKVESNLVGAAHGDRFQFERQGYFCVDPDSYENKLVFNRTVSLRDTWAKIMKKQH